MNFEGMFYGGAFCLGLFSFVILILFIHFRIPLLIRDISYRHQLLKKPESEKGKRKKPLIRDGKRFTFLYGEKIIE